MFTTMKGNHMAHKFGWTRQAPMGELRRVLFPKIAIALRSREKRIHLMEMIEEVMAKEFIFVKVTPANTTGWIRAVALDNGDYEIHVQGEDEPQVMPAAALRDFTPETVQRRLEELADDAVYCNLITKAIHDADELKARELLEASRKKKS